MIPVDQRAPLTVREALDVVSQRTVLINSLRRVHAMLVMGDAKQAEMLALATLDVITPNGVDPLRYVGEGKS